MTDRRRAAIQGQRWLRAFHLVFAATWLAAAIILPLVSFLVPAADGRQLVGIHQTAKFIDDFVLIPALIGTWLTGLLCSLDRRWGWSRHRWIAVKWAIAIAWVLFGTFGLGPCVNALPPIVGELGWAALNDPEYLRCQSFLLVGAPLGVCALVVAAFLSVLKPWGSAADAERDGAAALSLGHRAVERSVP